MVAEIIICRSNAMRNDVLWRAPHAFSSIIGADSKKRVNYTSIMLFPLYYRESEATINLTKLFSIKETTNDYTTPISIILVLTSIANNYLIYVAINKSCSNDHVQFCLKMHVFLTAATLPFSFTVYSWCWLTCDKSGTYACIHTHLMFLNG